ncbi:DoxX family protein [Patulibacter sp. NPDC049589]|uniref:DoxX family protein n=1 Tax=Patulibacter sp. NPDC049589 TaxID=3154731 RepID=UPI00343D55D0
MAVLFIVLALIFGAAGAAKVAGVPFTVDNFERWPIESTLRFPIGVIEVVLAILALVGIANDGAAIVSALGMIVAMAIATWVHVKGHDAPAMTAAAPITGLIAVIALVTL